MLLPMPGQVGELIAARDTLRDAFGYAGLTFTLDGKLVGDLGEALAYQFFDVELKAIAAIDGYTGDGRSVQIKSTGALRTVAFTHYMPPASLLLVLKLHYETLQFEVVFNGPFGVGFPEHGDHWTGQRQISLSALRARNNSVQQHERVPLRPAPLTV